MRKKLRAAAVAGVAVGALAFVPAGASAAHCTAPAGEESKPGFSYFGTDHVQGENGKGGTNQGLQGDGTSGASSCRETTGSPSERAPGQNR